MTANLYLYRGIIPSFYSWGCSRVAPHWWSGRYRCRLGGDLAGGQLGGDLAGGRSRCRSRRRSRSGACLRRRVSGAAESAASSSAVRSRPNTPRACRGAVRKSGVWFISPERSAACALATGTRLRPWGPSVGCCQISGIGILAATFPIARLPLAARSRLFLAAVDCAAAIGGDLVGGLISLC